MTERTGHWVRMKVCFLGSYIKNLNEFLFDVKYDIVEKCSCGVADIFVHYIV